MNYKQKRHVFIAFRKSQIIGIIIFCCFRHRNSLFMYVRRLSGLKRKKQRQKNRARKETHVSRLISLLESVLYLSSISNFHQISVRQS